MFEMTSNSTFVMASQGNRCWLCQNRALNRPYAVASQADQYSLIFLVCSPTCAEGVAKELSFDGTPARILCHEEVSSVLKEPGSHHAHPGIANRQYDTCLFVGATRKVVLEELI
jgi:hypothetical protein